MGDVPTSLLFVFPLFVAYEIGLLFVPLKNGADFLSGVLFDVVGGHLDYYLMGQGLLALVFIGFLMYWRRTRGFDTEQFLPMLFESLIYALTLGTLIVFVMDEFIGLTLSLGPNQMRSSLSIVVSALGAGVYEELVFRFFLCGGIGCWLGRDSKTPWLWLIVAIAVSSVLFSLVHYLGQWGDPWSYLTFTYRLLAGIVFASIFYFRSFAHAVYTHVFYDLYVMIF